MGFRFRKSIKILPGVRLNFSKSGVSTSIGVPGATVNLSKSGTRTTVGIPGTGISYSEQRPNLWPTQAVSDAKNTAAWFLWLLGAVAAGMVLYGIFTDH